jgi:hypothetical protein
MSFPTKGNLQLPHNTRNTWYLFNLSMMEISYSLPPPNQLVHRMLGRELMKLSREEITTALKK